MLSCRGLSDAPWVRHDARAQEPIPHFFTLLARNEENVQSEQTGVGVRSMDGTTMCPNPSGRTRHLGWTEIPLRQATWIVHNARCFVPCRVIVLGPQPSSPSGQPRKPGFCHGALLSVAPVVLRTSLYSLSSVSCCLLLSLRESTSHPTMGMLSD